MHFSVKVPGADQAGILEVKSPYSGDVVGTVASVDSAGVEQALNTSFSLYQKRNQWLPAARRAAILERMATLMEQRAEQLIAAAVAEGGKPYRDTQAELMRAIDGVKNCRECLRSESGREVPMQLNAASAGRLAFTHREPIGPVVAISAFNHPLNLIVHQIGPAIAAGCPVIVKPAEKTPLSAFLLVDLLREAGLPEAWCQPLVTENLTVAEALATDSRVAFLSFIGSAEVGWRLRSKLAPGTRCALEHGGAAPVIVADDADLDAMLPLLLKGAFYHAGQVCVSVQRIFAQRPIARDLAERLAHGAGELRVGDPANADTDVGPLIRPEAVERIDAWVNQALEAGADCLTGGKRMSEVLYPPTVLFDPDTASRVSREEIFGPVVCIYPYDTLDEAISRANDTPFAFQAAVMTRDIDTALYAYHHLQASSVMLNDHTAFRVDWMPFAGLKQSGYGVGGIPYTFREMQNEKMLVFHSAALR
ncbi:aldehyde dehydrogenase family protein [Methylomarinum sp. Ch1-1]|uniref:Aldehyde dehydrogenase family protein n=1 Tax=Methylomarinum roseum TaxID=3067653 RepID=A0AAU7NQW9_9GAMM|nr:aldehyde dehydrogenase family protein [Methylomarinum sp. Ch1-1]MDP4520688.1 aldehyde dehydrogenase family protein [Methylomarinum sp. Ch1-1]